MSRMSSLMQHNSASSIGPPMMKNRSLTPCAFRQRARISLPLISAIGGLLSRGFVLSWGAANKTGGAFGAARSPSHGVGVLIAEHLFAAQLGDIAAAQAQPAREHLLSVLAEFRRGFELRRLAVEAHRPSLAHPVAVRVMHRLHDAALLEARVILQFERVVHRAGRYPGRADDLHRLDLRVVLRPLGNDFVDEAFVLVALLIGREARIADQILAAD